MLTILLALPSSDALRSKFGDRWSLSDALSQGCNGAAVEKNVARHCFDIIDFENTPGDPLACCSAPCFIHHGWYNPPGAAGFLS